LKNTNKHQIACSWCLIPVASPAIKRSITGLAIFIYKL
uniref:Transcriptional regulator n=1 Tax=Brugia timori TaxID=42155 RepID=A0A0R3Q8L1_9BILA